MARKERRWLTFDEKQEIRQIIMEQKMYGWTNKEAVEICRTRLPKRPNLSFRTYQDMKIQEAEKNEVTKRITIQAKAGFIEDYMQRKDETTHVLQRLLRLFDRETSKPIEQQNVRTVCSLSRHIVEIEAVLSNLGLESPVLMHMKNVVDKGLANNELLNKQRNKKDRELTEENGEDRTNTDEFAA